jgi:hypothetical protein
MFIIKSYLIVFINSMNIIYFYIISIYIDYIYKKYIKNKFNLIKKK